MEERDKVLEALMSKIAVEENLSNIHYKFATGLNKKHGFMSSAFHVKLTGNSTDDNGKNEEKTLNLFIKFAPLSEKFQKDMIVDEAYRRETYLYEKVRPSYETLVNDFRDSDVKWDNAKSQIDSCQKHESQNMDFISKFYASSKIEGHKAIVMENLKDANYILIDEKIMLDDEHLRFGLRCYATLHGTGLALKHHNPNLFNEMTTYLGGSVYNALPDDGFFNLMKRILGIAKANLSSLSEVDDKIIEKFESYRERIRDIICNFEGDERYFTIIHGDCWRNNMMFKHAEENDGNSKQKLVSLKLLDWQTACFGPPINDLTHFFYANAAPEAYSQFETYKNYYYDTLCEQLVKLNLKPNDVFPREAFEKQVKRHAIFGILISFGVIFFRLFKNKMKDHEDLNGTNDTMFDDLNCETEEEIQTYNEATKELLRITCQNYLK